MVEDGSFCCAVCHQTCRTKQEVERHLESKHIETNPFTCEICGSQSKTRRALKVHLMRHHK